MKKYDLEKFAASENIAEDFLDEADLEKLSEELLLGIREDEDSMTEWLEYADRAIELTSLKREEKNIPFDKAANIKFPLIRTAVLQWASRAVPELLKNGEVCKYKIVGRDPDGKKQRRGYRIKNHINWQILEKMPRWFDERDTLFTQVAVVGTSFVKTWFDPIKSICRSETIPYDCLIVNNSIKSLEDAPRITHLFPMSDNDLVEQMRWGFYREMDVDTLTRDIEDVKAIYHEMAECHCWWDLDYDGYDEPYIVTMHKASGKILRIQARYSPESIQRNKKGQIKQIIADQYFSDYHFMPPPDNSFFQDGFGTILLDTNETINTILNQLINAGHLATTQGGFLGSELRATKETINIGPGEWKMLNNAEGANLKDNVVPLSYKEPSATLYQLLLFLIEQSNSLTSTTDVVTGNQDDLQNVSPNTIMSLMQQSLKVYSSISSRMMRGFKKELTKLVVLNSKYVNIEEYLELIDPSMEELQEMFDQDGNFLDYQALLTEYDIVPVVDNNIASETEMLMKSQQIFNMATQWAQFGVFNLHEVGGYVLRAASVEGSEKLVNPPPDPNQPNPEMIKMQAEMQKIQKELELKDREVKVKEFEAKLEAERTKADVAGKAQQRQSDTQIRQAELQLEAGKQMTDRVKTIGGLRNDAEKIRKDAERAKEKTTSKK